ncbi:MAG: flavin reductase family protein [Pigmentiphaga sp.]
MQKDERRISSDLRRVFRGFASTVSIVSVRGEDGNRGMTATAVSSVSMDPPSLLVVVNRSSGMYRTMLECKYFCINILGKEQIEHSHVFGGAAPMDERFEWGDWRLSSHDVPYLCEAQANIFCEKAHILDVGTHTIFVGTAYQMAIGDATSPLIYLNGAYYGVEHVSARPLGAALKGSLAPVNDTTRKDHHGRRL